MTDNARYKSLEVVLDGIRYTTKRTAIQPCASCAMSMFCGKFMQGGGRNNMAKLCSNLVPYDTYFIRKEDDDGGKTCG